MDKKPSFKATWDEAGQMKTATVKPGFKIQSDYEIEAARRHWPAMNIAPTLAMQWQVWQTLVRANETALGFNSFRDALDEFEIVNKDGTDWKAPDPDDDDQDDEDEMDPTQRADE